MGWGNWNPVNIVKNAVSAVRSVTGGLAGAIQSVASNLVSTARGITGAVYDQIGALAQKIGNTVEKIASDPKMLAAVAVNFAFPGAGAAIGEWILGAETAASIGAAATTAVGNACLNTAMNGGDMQKGIETAVTSYVGNVGSQQLSQYIKNATDVPDALAKNVGTTTTYAAIQAAMGKDPTTALLTGGANACAQLLTQQVPGFSDMPPEAQAAITKATASALQGKAGGAVNAAIDFATKFAKDEYKSYKDANDNGFGYDANAWRDANKIGILDPKDYQYAKTIGADNPYDLQVGKNVGAKDNLDLTLARDTGVTTADDLAYAKQVGVNNKDDFTLAKDVGAQDLLDFNLAKTIGLDNPNDLTYAKTVGINNTDDFDLAKNIGAQKYDDIELAKVLGIDTSKDFNYAKIVGATTAEDFDLANQTEAKDATDLGVAKQYGITDKDTLNQYSDFLGRGTEKSSTSTIKGADGTELTIDNEGNLVKYTYQTDDGTKDITDEVEKVASRSGGYTIRGDDGSTITINPDGTVSATEAVEGFYDVPGTKKPAVSYARLVGQALQNRSATQQTQEGGVNQATVDATQRMRENPLNKTGYQVTAEDIASIAPLFFGQEQSYQQPTSEGGAEDAGLAKVEVGGPSETDINYLANLGGKPSYLGSLDQTASGEGGQPGQGKDAGARTEGPTPPPGTEKNIGGGGGYGQKYVSSGSMGDGAGSTNISDIISMLQSQGGASQYGSQRDAETNRLLQTLKTAGLQDQSDAETQRLLGAQGPVAIGQVPVKTQPIGMPATPAAPAKVASISAVPDNTQDLAQLLQLPGSAAGVIPGAGPTFVPKTLADYLAYQLHKKLAAR